MKNKSGARFGAQESQTDGARRRVIKSSLAIAGAGAVAASVPTLPKLLARSAYAAGSDKPIRIGFQVHRTGIGALYGRWYERTTNAATKVINDMGGIAGRPVEIVPEDDGTDPKRGAEVVEKLAVQHKVDFVYGPLFSHVVIGSAPRAGELKIPYFVVSEGYHVASGKLNRYVFQPGITDVRAQVTAVSSWFMDKLGKKIAMIFPDYAFGYDHRDFMTAAAKARGGEVIEKLAIPPTESSYTKYFPRIPPDTEVLYHVMVGPGVLTFVKEMGEHFGSKRPEIFGFIDSLEGVDIASPGLGFLDGTYLWEAMPRYADGYATEHVAAYRKAVGIDDNGASVDDAKDVSANSHMFGCWETLFAIKQAVEQSGYKGPADYPALIETLEKTEGYEESMQHPQGAKVFNGKVHQCYGQQFVSKVAGGKLNVVHKTSIDDGMYEAEADYTTQAL
ncbi:MAG: ABC transporter substrate-binding protein [Gammaproteobacteria bacterium]